MEVEDAGDDTFFLAMSTSYIPTSDRSSCLAHRLILDGIRATFVSRARVLDNRANPVS